MVRDGLPGKAAGPDPAERGSSPRPGTVEVKQLSAGGGQIAGLERGRPVEARGSATVMSVATDVTVKKQAWQEGRCWCGL